MMSNSIPWKSAEGSDARYKIYLDNLDHFSLFERYPPAVKNLLVFKIDLVWNDDS